MSILQKIFELMKTFTDWVWGIPLTVFLACGGLLITIVIGGIQFRHLGFIFKNTIGGFLDKEERKRRKLQKTHGVSPVQTVIVAVGASVGTGNIIGVGTAIALGGPGALLWMWITSIFIMGMKYSENTLSCLYREKDQQGSKTSYKAGPYMYISKGLNAKWLANIFAIAFVLFISIIAGLHSGSVSSNLVTFGVPKIITTILITIIAITVALGGLPFLVKITDKMVPFMGIIYIILGLTVMLLNISDFGYVFLSIFRGAFTGQAAIGGFSGATMAMALRWGVARACYSNDAGLGGSACLCAQATDIGHPAKQGMWAVIEVFIDTIIVCSTTGFIILFSGSWQSGEEGATLALTGVSITLGSVGKIIYMISLVLFALSSLFSCIELVRIQGNTLFKSAKITNMSLIILLFLVFIVGIVDISPAFVFADFINAVLIFINVPCVLLLHKVLRKTSKEWFDTKGHPEQFNSSVN